MMMMLMLMLRFSDANDRNDERRGKKNKIKNK
jgi:hypothetical protein